MIGIRLHKGEEILEQEIIAADWQHGNFSALTKTGAVVEKKHGEIKLFHGSDFLLIDSFEFYTK